MTETGKYFLFTKTNENLFKIGLICVSGLNLSAWYKHWARALRTYCARTFSRNYFFKSTGILSEIPGFLYKHFSFIDFLKDF